MLVGITLSAWDKAARDLLVALIANTACVLYYGAPCSSMYRVVASRDSSSLLLPMIGVNFLNAILWTVYGYFALHDMFVVVPNGIGLCLSVLQLCLIAVFPSSQRGRLTSAGISVDGVGVFGDGGPAAGTGRGDAPLLYDKLSASEDA
jgi:solute carrier family 50 protein (sugar transporter)